MWPPKLPAYQMLPSLSSIRPCGPAGLGNVYSRSSPLWGSRRPSLFANCPDHQIEPSGIASGSWGREPGVGVSHARNSTFAGPSITTGFVLVDGGARGHHHIHDVLPFLG